MTYLKSLVAAALLLPSAVLAEPRLDLSSQPTPFGLYPLLDTEMDRVYALPDAGLAFFRSVHVAPVNISYRRGRDSSGQPLSFPLDREKLVEMSEYLSSQLKSRLVGSGYEVVDAPTLGTLELRASLTGLRLGPGAEADSATSPNYFDSIADVTLVIELSDATTGELLVQVVDAGQAIREAGAGVPVTAREAMAALLDGWAALVARRMAQIKRLGGALTGN